MVRRHVKRNAALLFLAGVLLLSTGCAWFGGRKEQAPVPERTTGQSAAAPPRRKHVQIRTAPAPTRLLAFDFGTAVSWEGFSAVPGAKNVTISSPSTFGTGERGGDFPDPLLGDFASAEEMTVTVTGLQKGSYRAAIIAQNALRGMVPARNFKIAANGRRVIDVEVTPEWYYSDQGFFYGVQFDDVPGDPFWDRYIETVAPWRRFEFRSEGELTLKFSNCNLYALVIAPENTVNEREFVSFIEATQASRKAYFLFNKFRFTPQPARGRMPRAKAHMERGYTVFSRHWGSDVTYNSLPKPREITRVVQGAGTPGQRVPITFSVRSYERLRGMNVRVTDLSAPGRKSIPAEAVDVQAVRYMLLPGNGGFHISPETIQAQQDIELPEQMTKRWWLTVNIPKSAEPGLYIGQVRLTAEGAPGSVLTLKLRVHSFELAEAATSIGVWYSDPISAAYFTETFGGVNVPVARGDGYKLTENDRKAEAIRLKMLEADLKSLGEHGFNGITVPMPRVTGVSASGRTSLDFGLLEPYKALLRKYRINTDFPGQGNLSDVAAGIANANVGGAPVDEFSELHGKAYRSAVTQIRDWWQAAGVKMLAFAADEPSERGQDAARRNVKAALYYLNLIGEIEGFPSTVTTLRDVQNGVSCMPVIEAEDVVQPRPSVHNSESIKAARKSGKALRFFNRGEFQRYDFGFYLWAKKAEGYWQKSYNRRGFSFNPFWDSHGGYAVFPSPEGPIATPGYERAAQGIYDYRYALTLEKYIALAKSSYNSEAADAAGEGEALLERIRRNTTAWVIDRNGKPLSVAPERLTEWRAEIARHIEEIKTALE